jgi:predicted 3-demethylubiquinone-9 3-methyltransferase (glyoxalase superfamily)
MQKITPFLWFDDQAEEAARFYTSIFQNSKITGIAYYGENSQKPEGTVMTVNFQIEGQDFIALNGGPYFTFTPAISLFVNCENQAEVDELWARLTEGGEEEQCGWLKDKYGVSWQIIPVELLELINSNDAERSQRATEAMLQMIKIDIAKIRQAFAGGLRR